MAPMGSDAMSTGDAMSPMGDSMMMGGGGKTIMITIENVLTGQPFSPSYFEAHAAGAAPLFKLGDTASEALAAVVSAGSMPMG
jgi:hypothetical protein